MPCHCIAIELEELEQVLSLLPVPGLLLSGQGVIRHEQGVGAAACQRNGLHLQKLFLKMGISTHRLIKALVMF